MEITGPPMTNDNNEMVLFDVKVEFRRENDSSESGLEMNANNFHVVWTCLDFKRIKLSGV